MRFGADGFAAPLSRIVLPASAHLAGAGAPRLLPAERRMPYPSATLVVLFAYPTRACQPTIFFRSCFSTAEDAWYIPYFCGSITGMSSNDPRRCWAHRSCSLFCDVFVVSPGKAQNAHAGKQTCLRVGKCPCFQCRTRMLHAVLSKFRSRKAHAGDANCVRWSPSGGGVLATGGDGEMVRVWCYAPPACCRRCSVL